MKENDVHTLRDAAARWHVRVKTFPVGPSIDRDAIRERLARYDFREPIALEAVVRDLAELLERGTLHATHPRYFGLFNASSGVAGLVADAMVALYNPQVGAWWHAPA